MVTHLSLRYDEAAYLAAYLRRLMLWDERTCVRVQVAGQSLGVYGVPPLDCLSFIAVPLDSEVNEPLDRVVSAGRLRDVLGEVSPTRWGTSRSFPVPDELGAVAALAVLPPRGPWLPAERGIAGDVRPIVAAGVEEFRVRAERSDQSSTAELEALARDVWSRPGWGGLPLASLHAASLLGFMPHDGLQIGTSTCEGWKRFAAPGGMTFIRTSGLPPTLSLAVARG